MQDPEVSIVGHLQGSSHPNVAKGAETLGARGRTLRGERAMAYATVRRRVGHPTAAGFFGPAEMLGKRE
jgi:hypothetical protein